MDQTSLTQANWFTPNTSNYRRKYFVKQHRKSENVTKNLRHFH
jgi:hypothetical protein